MVGSAGNYSGRAGGAAQNIPLSDLLVSEANKVLENRRFSGCGE
jgi:hypothetical protein